MARVDPERMEQFLFDLQAPLPGQASAPVSEIAAEDEGQAFMDAMAMNEQMGA